MKEVCVTFVSTKYKVLLIETRDTIISMEEKTWTVVQFTDDGTVEAVPSSWIQGDHCYWPPFPSDKVLQTIKKCEEFNTCWPTHRIKIFRNASFDDYYRARLKTKIAEFTSDLNTDSEDVTKRRRVPKIISSDSDSSDTRIPTPPKLKKAKKTMSASCSQKPLKASQKGPEVEKDIGSSSAYVVINEANHNNINSSCKSCTEKDKYLKTISEQLHMVRGITVDILSEIKNLKKDIQNCKKQEEEADETFSRKFPNITFPIATDEEMNVLEEILDNRNNFQLLVYELAKIGGTNPYNFAKRVLSTCVTNDTALKYSWLGRKGKRPFSKMKLANVIVDAADRANIGSHSEMETAVQTWLKRASDRRKSLLNKTV